MKDKKELKVSAIKNGTVIDHIPASKLFKVIDILKLYTIETPITFGTNLESKKLGSKAIIKIADKFFEKDEINRIALIAPEAQLNIIKDYQVVEKKTVQLPNEISGIAKCFNPKCVTNHEDVTTRFSVEEKDGKMALKCHYCEKIMEEENINFL